MYIMRKEIDVENSKILYGPAFSDDVLKNDWEITGGDWSIQDGWLTGIYRGNGGGLIYTNKEYPGDIMLDFYARTIPPCNNDLNFSWKTDGWDYDRKDAAKGYIAGLNGWWENKAGIEKYPACTPAAMTPLFDVKAGQTYHIQAGNIGSHCFMCVDGNVIVEMLDPNPEVLTMARVGLGTYCSQVQFKDFKVREIEWTERNLSYTANF